MNKYWHTGEIIEIFDEAPKIKRYRIKLKDLESFDFKAGQFVALELPIHENPKKRIRYYSIASAPDGTSIFELVIVLKDDGLGTSYLFFKCDVGSEIKVQNPNGKFFLPQKIEKDLCLICTGTGLAPFRSMIHYIFDNQIPHEEIYLLFGTRFEDDIIYRKEFEELAIQHREFHYHITLSREENFLAQNSHIQAGYVHVAYKKEFTDKRPAYFYICGWSGMIQEAKKHLRKMGYGNQDFFHEVFV